MGRGKNTSIYLTEKELEILEELSKYGFELKPILRFGMMTLKKILDEFLTWDLLMEVLEDKGIIELYNIRKEIEKELSKENPDYQKIVNLMKKYNIKLKLLKRKGWNKI